MFADQYEKPKDISKYRSRTEGGLGMHHIECKADAMLCKTFMELACSSIFKRSLLFNSIFRYYILENTDLPDPGILKPYRYGAIQKIKQAKKDGKDIVSMDSRAWYQYFLNRTVLQRETQEDGIATTVPVKSPSEEKQPHLEWGEIWERARLKGLSNNSRSFLFLLLNDLLMTKERQHKTTRNTPSPECTKCMSGSIDNSLTHTFSSCPYMADVINWLVSKISSFDPDVSPSNLVRLQFKTTNEEDKLIATWLIAESLAYAWARRQSNLPISMNDLKLDLRTKAGFMAASSRFSSTGKKLTSLVED